MDGWTDGRTDEQTSHSVNQRMNKLKYYTHFDNVNNHYNDMITVVIKLLLLQLLLFLCKENVS